MINKNSLIFGCLLIIASLFLITITVKADDNYYVISDNKVISDNYKIIISDKIISNLLIDDINIYFYSNKFFYSANKSNGSINYKINILLINNFSQSPNYIFLKADNKIYKINKISGLIENKNIFSIPLENIFTFFIPLSLNNSVINNYINTTNNLTTYVNITNNNSFFYNSSSPSSYFRNFWQWQGVETNGSWAWNSESRQSDYATIRGDPAGYFWNSNSNAEYAWKNIYLSSGIYNLTIVYWTSNDHGIALVNFSSLQIDSIDMYSGSAVWNIVRQTTFKINSSIKADLKFVHNGKNPSATNYGIMFSRLQIEKIGEA